MFLDEFLLKIFEKFMKKVGIFKQNSKIIIKNFEMGSKFLQKLLKWFQNKSWKKSKIFMMKDEKF